MQEVIFLCLIKICTSSFFSAPAQENIFSPCRWSSSFCSASKANIYIPPSTFTVTPILPKNISGRSYCQKVCFRDASARRNHKYSDCFFVAALSAAKLAKANYLVLMCGRLYASRSISVFFRIAGVAGACHCAVSAIASA